MKNEVENICDKCGEPVPRSNDSFCLALEVEKIKRYGVNYDEAQVDPWIYTAILTLSSRHLLPVKEGEHVICEGSPSRAQFIEGQPRDTRGYPYRAEDEVIYRAAFAKLQQS